MPEEQLLRQFLYVDSFATEQVAGDTSGGKGLLDMCSPRLLGHRQSHGACGKVNAVQEGLPSNPAVVHSLKPVDKASYLLCPMRYQWQLPCFRQQGHLGGAITHP